MCPSCVYKDIRTQMYTQTHTHGPNTFTNAKRGPARPNQSGFIIRNLDTMLQDGIQFILMNASHCVCFMFCGPTHTVIVAQKQCTHYRFSPFGAFVRLAFISLQPFCHHSVYQKVFLGEWSEGFH